MATAQLIGVLDSVHDWKSKATIAANRVIKAYEELEMAINLFNEFAGEQPKLRIVVAPEKSREQKIAASVADTNERYGGVLKRLAESEVENEAANREAAAKQAVEQQRAHNASIKPAALDSYQAVRGWQE